MLQSGAPASELLEAMRSIFHGFHDSIPPHRGVGWEKRANRDALGISTEAGTVVSIDNHHPCPSLCGRSRISALCRLGLVQEGRVTVGGLWTTLSLLLILGSRWTTEQKLI